jgi:hypothetical protein
MWIKLSKLFYVLLVMYYGWFQFIFFKIPNMLLFLGSSITISSIAFGMLVAYYNVHKKTSKMV